MELHTRMCLVLMTTFILSRFLLYACRKLDGYDFPVYSTEYCPRNQAEWNDRSSAINCTEQNGYMCVPNDRRTDLLEFCYSYPFLWFQEGVCLYLYKRFSELNSYNCSHFISGCPNSSYQSFKSFDYPSCTAIGNGCFLAEPFCVASTTTYYQGTTNYVDRDNIATKDKSNNVTMFSTQTTKQIYIANTSRVEVLVGTLFGAFTFLFVLCLIYYIKQHQKCKRTSDVESHEEEERKPFLHEKQNNKKKSSKKGIPFGDTHLQIGSQNESLREQAIFEQWQQDNKFFISTKASEAVETHTRNQNLVIVTGHSGSGKSSIIQHIALKYRSNGWIVKPIDEIDEFLHEYSIGKIIINKTLFVFHDPIGKASIDEIAFNRWNTHEETLKACLKKVKLIVSCRKYTLYDNRIKGILKDKSNIVDISQDQLKLSNDDKQRIWDIYSNHKQLSPEELEEILNAEEYFPLLCKLNFSMDRNRRDESRFFKEPKEVFEEEIRNFRVSSKEKYCSLVLLVLFNDVLNVKDILETDASREKFKLALELCELKRSTAPHTIGDALETLNGFFVKKVCDTYHFSHDFIMEVTTYVFGTDYPKATIKYADIGLLRKNVRLQSFNNENNPLTIYLSNEYIEDLGKRLFSEMFGEHLLEVVLNPCLKDESITNVCMQELNHDSINLEKLLEKKDLQIEKQNIYDAQESKKVISSKLAFMNFENETSPLNALIVFGHTRLSLFCLQALMEMSISLKDKLLFSSVCCNGSLALFDIFLKDEIKEFLTEKWGPLYPIHIASAFHNSEILEELLRIDKSVNIMADDDGWTPLILAAAYDSCEYDDNFKESETKRNETVKLLLRNGANINLCDEDGTSPLYAACQEGHDSTVQLLLSKGADINLCDEDGSPLSIACQEGHTSTVQLLLSKGAAINLCDNDKTSPLFLACQEGHDNTVQLLLSKGADFNLCDVDGTSPLFIACQEGHSEIVQHLLRHGANINLCDEEKTSPLYIACQEGHESIVKLLLENGADVNLCDENRESPLFKACKNGDNEIIKLLIAKGADINLSEINGISPLYVAFAWRHCETVKILLECGADTSVLHGCGSNSLSVDCYNKDDQNILFLLQSNNIIDNIYDIDSFFTLFVFCQVEQMLRMSE